MRSLSFIINSNLFIAFAAVTLTMATQVQLDEKPQFQFYIAAIFFATLLEYNFHRLISVNNNKEAFPVEKNNWASGHLPIIKVLILSSIAGLVFSMLFVSISIIIAFGLLSVFTFFYSAENFGKNKILFGYKGITGMKTIAIAFVWATITVYLPVLHLDTGFDTVKIFLLFAQRFAFIFAIAIPFDIRDMDTDSRAGTKSLPIVFGSRLSVQIANFALLLSLIISIVEYFRSEQPWVFLACLLSVSFTSIVINSRKIKNMPFYYHGILDGCLVLYGLLIWLSYYLDGLPN